MSGRKIVRKFQELVDEKDPKKKLGRVHTNPPSVFSINDPKVSTPSPNYDKGGNIDDRNKDREKIANISFQRYTYNHDRGATAILNPYNFNAVSDLHIRRADFVAFQGNFTDYIPEGDNLNIQYKATINVKSAVRFPIKVRTLRNASVSIYTQSFNKTTYTLSEPKRQYASETHNPDTIINLDFGQGGAHFIAIFVYQQKKIFIIDGAFVELKGDLGRALSLQAVYIGPKDVVVQFNKKPQYGGTNGVKTEYVDASYNPSLKNVIWWNRVDAGTSNIYGGMDIDAYRISRLMYEDVGYQVVSGWNSPDGLSTIGFTVTGDKRYDFPVALPIQTGAGLTSYRVSGTDYLATTDSGNPETLVYVSGTDWAGSAADIIHVQKPAFVAEIKHDRSLSPVVSGADLDVEIGQTYNYVVSVIDRQGSIYPYSEVLSITVGQDLSAPSQATDLLARGGNKRIFLSWNNPDNLDLKGINIWDQDNPDSTVRPIATVLKNTNSTILTGTYVSEHSGAELVDQTNYTYYISTFDWAGNEDTTSMPSVSAETLVNIKTSQSGQRIEIDTDSNQIRFYDSGDNLTVRIGESVYSNDDGVEINQGSLIMHAIGGGNDFVRLSPDSTSVFSTLSRPAGALVAQAQIETNTSNTAIAVNVLDGGGGNYTQNRQGVQANANITGGSPNTLAQAVYAYAFNDTGFNNAFSFYGDGGILFNTDQLALGTTEPNVSGSGIHVAQDDGTLPLINPNTAILASNCSAATDSTWLSLIAGNTGECRINMGDTADEDIFNWTYDHDENELLWKFGGSDTSPCMLLDVINSRLVINAQSTGLTPSGYLDIYQSGSTASIVFRGNDVTHGMTSIIATDIHGLISKQSDSAGSEGGLTVAGYTEADDVALNLLGFTDTADSTTGTGALGAVTIQGNKRDGSTSQAMGADENIMVVRTGSAARVIFKGDGDVEADGTVTSTSYDLAEWMPAEEEVKGSVPIGLNLETGKVRQYRSGDELIGVHSLNPAFVANNDWSGNNKDHVLVGLVGQFKDIEDVHIDGRRVYTKDRMFQIGFMLASGRVLLRIKDVGYEVRKYPIE